MSNGNRRYKRRTRPSRKKSSIGAMDVILIIVGISLFAFTVAMMKIFREYGAVPDTLVTCVFATLGGECGIMGWIKTTKDRNKERKGGLRTPWRQGCIAYQARRFCIA